MSLCRKKTTAQILSNLRILKAKNPGDNYYDEYLKHFKREGDNFFDQYHVAIDAATRYRPTRILEIGVRTGLSICNMLTGYTDLSIIKRIVLIDLWPDDFASPEVVKMNLKVMNFPELPIEFIKGDSRQEVPELKEEFDYILVDGDHTKEVAGMDLENVVRLCARGGMIVLDDLSEFGCNLRDVWKNFESEHAGKFNFADNYHGKGVGWAIKK